MARKLEVEIVGDASKLNRSLNQAHASTSKFGGTLSKLKYAAIGAGAAIGGGLVIGMKDSVGAAIEAQKQQARLAVSFRNAGLQIKPYEAQIRKLEATSRRLGFTDEETMQSLGSLITVTHNYRKAVREMAIAQDLARFKGVSLEQATKALTMAHAGSLRALKQLGLDVPKVTDAQDKLKATVKKHSGAAYENALAMAKQQDKAATLANVLETVHKATKGQAQAFSDTAAGAMAQFHAQLQHIEVELGQKLLPIITNTIIWVRTHWPEISKVVQQSWAQIKPIWTGMANLITAIVDTIKRHWGTLGPIFKQVVGILRNVMVQIQNIIKLFTDIFKGDWGAAWQDIKNIAKTALDGIWREIKLMFTVYYDVAKALGGMIWQGLKAGVEAGLDAIKSAITDLFGKVIGWAKHALGIKSPSTVFHSIGQQAIRGFINGVGSMAGALKHAVVSIAEHAATSIYHGAGSLLHGGKATGSGANMNLGQKMAAAYGWIGDQWRALNFLWTQESGWSNTAKNAKSGAYGIAQALPPTKMPYAAQEAGGSNPAAQIAWGLQYIKSRYGSPIAAWGHEQSVGWYGKGGIFSSPTIIGVGESGPEAVVPLNRGGMGKPLIVNLVLDNKVAAQALIDPLRGEAQVFKQRTGKAAFA